MSDEQGKHYLFIGGQAVPVSEQVFQAYHHYERKEEYFTYDLKAEGFVCDQEAQTAIFTPSREDSYERLLEANSQFAEDAPATEDQVFLSMWMETLLGTLTEQERYIVSEIVLKQRTEREVSEELHISQNTLNYHKKRALRKLREYIEKNS